MDKATEAQRREAEIEFDRRMAGPVMVEEDVARESAREAGLKSMEFFFRGLRLLAQYEGNRDMALDCFVLAHGQGEMIGMQTAVQVAEKHFGDPKKKAAVTKCIKLFQDCLNIPPMPGQREESGRLAMGEARMDQLE